MYGASLRIKCVLCVPIDRSPYLASNLDSLQPGQLSYTPTVIKARMVRYFGMRSKNRHVERVNRVLDYVGQNLDGDLSLATLSGVSGFSAYHFHRWRDAANVPVKVSRTGAFRYVYIRVFEPYGNKKLVDAYYSLFNWLGDRGTDIRDVVFIGMSLDDPAVTPSEKCRFDLGVAFPQDGLDGILYDIVRSRGRSGAHPPLPGQPECAARGFSIREFESQEIAALRCTRDIAHVERAWQCLYRVWLPSARFDPADMPAMEMFVKLPEEIGWETFDLQLCIPVVRL